MPKFGIPLLIVAATGLILATAETTHASVFTADPDSFAAGTNITNAFQNVTLSSVGAGFDGDFDTNIFSINPSTQALEPYSASTGRLVFGTNDGTSSHLFGRFGGAKMRIDFGVFNVKLVLLDGISNNGSDIARLQAFDSTNTILGTYTTAALALSQFETMSVTSAAGNIAYVLASGVSGDSVGFDNLKYEVPEPGTIAIFGFGLVGLGYMRRRRAA